MRVQNDAQSSTSPVRHSRHLIISKRPLLLGQYTLTVFMVLFDRNEVKAQANTLTAPLRLVTKLKFFPAFEWEFEADFYVVTGEDFVFAANVTGASLLLLDDSSLSPISAKNVTREYLESEDK